MKLTNKYSIIPTLLFIAISIFSCKKIEPPFDDKDKNDPIYKVQGLMNGDSLNIYVDDTTVFVSEYPHSINGVESYVSEIHDVANAISLRFILIRPEILINAEGINFFQNEYINYLVHESKCIKIKFSDNEFQENYFYINQNGQYIKSNTINLLEYGNYVFPVKFSNISPNEFHLPIKYGFSEDYLDPYFTVTSSNDTLYFNADNNDLNHTWRLNNEIISNQPNGFVKVENGVHNLTHEIKDGFDNKGSYAALVSFSMNEFSWITDYKSCDGSTISNNYGKAIIEMNVKNQLFSTAHQSSNNDYKIKVSDIEYFGLLGGSNSTKKIKFTIEFDADLKNKNNTESIQLRKMKATLFVSFT